MLGQVYLKWWSRRGETLIFTFGGSEVVLPSRRNAHFHILGHLGGIFGHLGGILASLGPSWAHLGATLEHLGPTWVQHGAILGPSWGHLGQLWVSRGGENGAPVEAKRSFLMFSFF